ncbi:MFS transporter, partial [Micromonospora azadirachtae]
DSGGGVLPDVHTLPAPIRAVVEGAYGHGAGDIFLAAAPFTLLALIAVSFIKEVPLRRHNDDVPIVDTGRKLTVATATRTDEQR